MGVGIEVYNLNAWYGSNLTLQDITPHIQANEATALIGPPGCGKSTFVRCLNRMHETTPIARVAGKVKVGGLDICGAKSAVEMRRRIRMVFQRPNSLPTMTICDNVASGLKLNGFRNERALDEVVERSLKYSSLGDEVKDTGRRSRAPASRAGSSSACASRALAGRGSGSAADGRAGLGARSGIDVEDRGSDVRAEIAVHHRDRELQQAAGRACGRAQRVFPERTAYRFRFDAQNIYKFRR
jgi:phosphate transport system ATP-binding protein